MARDMSAIFGSKTVNLDTQNLNPIWNTTHVRGIMFIIFRGGGCGKPLPYFRPDTIFHTLFQTCRGQKAECRGVFREGGEGRPPLSSGSGIFWDNILEWYMNLYEPMDSRRRNAHKNVAFAKLLPAFPEI